MAYSPKNPNGQATMANSEPVVIASDQSAVPVSGTVTATQGTATNLKTQAEAYQGGSAVGAVNPLQVSLANTGANATAVKVDGSAVTQPVSGTVTANLAAGTNNIGDVDVLSIAAGDNNIGNVDIVTMPGVVGTVADDGTTPGNPVMIGGKAVETDGTDPSSVSAEDDVAIARTDRNRRLLVNTFHPNLWSVNDNQSSAQTNTVLKAAPGANLSLYITDIVLSNGATAGDIRIVEDPAGTPVIKVPKIYLSTTSGMSKKFSTPIRITANKAIGYTSTTVTTHSILVNGFTAP